MASRIANKIQWLAEHYDQVQPETLTGLFASLSKLRVGDWRVLFTIDVAPSPRSTDGGAAIHAITRWTIPPLPLSRTPSICAHGARLVQHPFDRGSATAARREDGEDPVWWAALPASRRRLALTELPRSHIMA